MISESIRVFESLHDVKKVAEAQIERQKIPVIKANARTKSLENEDEGYTKPE